MAQTSEAEKLVVLKVGWMKYYQGLANGDRIRGAGDFIKQNKWGGEILNFQPYKDHYYGCAQTSESALVHRLGGESSIDDVLVVWAAPSPYKTGVYVVGWYRNATIHGDRKFLPRAAGRIHKGRNVEYLVEAQKDNATLLTEGARTFRVPVKKGWMGSLPFVFYADESHQHKWRKQLMDYVDGQQLQHAKEQFGDEDISSVEGDPRVQLHKTYERDPEFIKQCKTSFANANGKLFCEICKFDFAVEFGKLGQSFIEAHHVIPVAQPGKKILRSTNDIMMLCRNCHFMVHRLIKYKGEVTRLEAMKLLDTKWTSQFL